MCAGGEHADVIQIFVKDKIVHVRELVQVSFRWSFELDVGSQLNFIARPAFDCYRTSRRGDQSHRAAVRKTALSHVASKCASTVESQEQRSFEKRQDWQKQTGLREKEFEFSHRSS